jgi:hypothetical protein
MLIKGDVMNRYTKEDLEEALRIISSIIIRCEKAQPKLAEGTSHHTLMTNRINAMYVSKSLITDGNGRDKYTKDELVEALRPIYSVSANVKEQS